jgi:hypothetical protein
MSCVQSLRDGLCLCRSPPCGRLPCCLCGSPPRGRLACVGGMRAIAHRGGLLQTPPRRIVLLPLWEPTPWAIGLRWRYACNRPQGWAPTNTPTANCFVAFVGAHPVGDWLALAVCVQSPTGVGSYKHPHGELFCCLCGSPPRGRLACVGGMRAIAHRGGLLQTPPRRIVLLPLWEPTPWAIGLPWRCA